MSNDGKSNPVLHERQPFQYTLKTLLIITTIVAILCAGLFAAPGWIRLFTLYVWLIVYLTVVTAMIIYGGNQTRTFFIGVLIGSGLMILTSILTAVELVAPITTTESSWDEFVKSYEDVGFGPAIYVGITLCLGAIAGLVALVTRRLIESAQKE